MVMPIGAQSFNECMQWAIEIYGALKSLLASKGLSTAVGDEGGFAPDLKSNQEAIELILQSIEDCGHNPQSIVKLVLLLPDLILNLEQILPHHQPLY